MSKLVVEVCRVDAIEPHPNADRLAIATIKGWRTCIKHDPVTGLSQFAVGDKCVFLPPDAILPPALANAPDDAEIPGRLGVKNYLGHVGNDANGQRVPGGRVRATRLRSVASYGLIMAIDPTYGDDPDWPIGHDVAEHFGITKWEPPPENVAGDAETAHPAFHAYTSIESFGNFPTAIPDGEEVVITEKIHGTNSRVGVVLEGGDTLVFMAGSHGVRRKYLDAKGRESNYWKPLDDKMRALLESELRERDASSVIVFGEIYGSGVQDMAYGHANGERGYAAFDIAVDGRYLDYADKTALLQKHGIAQVPFLYCGPFSREVLEQFTSGPTAACEPSKAGKFQGREGVVVTPTREQYSDVLGGRMILKSVSADYLGRKGGTDSH